MNPTIPQKRNEDLRGKPRNVLVGTAPAHGGHASEFIRLWRTVRGAFGEHALPYKNTFSPKPKLRGRFFSHFIIATMITFFGAALAQQLLFHRIFFAELVFASLVAVAHGALALWINVGSIGKNTTRFFLWAFGLNTFRFVFLLILLATIKKLNKGNFSPFLVAALWGYLVFMVSEIGSLHRQSMRDL